MKFYLGSMRIACGLHGRNVEEIEAFIPKDPRTAIRRLDLEPQYTSYVCCSRCFKLYPMESFPIHCDNSTFPNGQPCNRRLHAREKPIEKSPKSKSRKKEHPVPNRTYSYQSLNHWIGWMYNRKELGQYLDRPYEKPNNPDRTVSDLWDSDFLGEFVGPDGKNLFVSPSDTNESRLLFNLNADGFNPFGNRTAGKKVTVWGIYMVCINLPPALRYKPENVFLVGVVPGPKEPTFDQISFILTLLLDDLEVLWETGIFLNRTRRHPLGRSIRAALIALVCDLPAARLLAGFSHFSGNLPCSMCKESDLNNLDESSFILRTMEEHRKLAAEWLAAQSQEERDALYKTNGVRWSPLLRLVYWDPIQNTVIDPMHGFYLRILQRHCRDIWGMNVKFQDNDGLWDIEEPSPDEKIRAQQVFRHGTQSALNKLLTCSIRYFALREELDYRRNKKALMQRLLELVSPVQRKNLCLMLYM